MREDESFLVNTWWDWNPQILHGVGSTRANNRGSQTIPSHHLFRCSTRPLQEGTSNGLNWHGPPALPVPSLLITELLLEPESPHSDSDLVLGTKVFTHLCCPSSFESHPTTYEVISRLHCWHIMSLLLNEPYKSYLEYSWTLSPWEICLSSLPQRIIAHVLLPPLVCQLVIYLSDPMLMPVCWDLFTRFWRDALSKCC